MILFFGVLSLRFEFFIWLFGCLVLVVVENWDNVISYLYLCFNVIEFLTGMPEQIFEAFI